MKKKSIGLGAAVATSGALTMSVVADIQHDVIPGAYADTPGTGVFFGPLTSGERTNQMLMHESLLTDLVGRQLTGMSFRLPVSASDPWPGQDMSYSFFDVYLSESVAPADRSLTFSENVVGPQTQVRSGGLTIDAGDYPGGSSPNEFGSEIDFDSGWTYTGGHLLLEFRHSGNGVTSRTVDALTTGTSGYGTLFSAAWAGNADATTGLQGNFSIVQFSSIPAPGALALLGLAGLVGACRRRD